jgi:hypothetical protein
MVEKVKKKSDYAFSFKTTNLASTFSRYNSQQFFVEFTRLGYAIGGNLEVVIILNHIISKI